MQGKKRDREELYNASRCGFCKLLVGVAATFDELWRA